MSAIDPSAAAALVAAAAGSCPADAPDWSAQVRARAFELLRLVPDVVQRAAVLDECRPVTGVILSVKDVSGRAVITTRPTMGTQEDGKTEDFRTPWLNEPDGAAMAARARSLVGHHCRFGKRVEAAGPDKKVRMCEWIEDLGLADESRVATRESLPHPSTQPAGPVALCSKSYRDAILSMARQILLSEESRDTFARWRTASGIPTLRDSALTAEQAARVRTFLAGMRDQVGGAA